MGKNAEQNWRQGYRVSYTMQYSAYEIESNSEEGSKCIDLKYLESETKNKQSGGKMKKGKKRGREEGRKKIREEKSQNDF